MNVSGTAVKSIIGTAVASLVVNNFAAFAEYSAVSPRGSDAWIFVSSLLAFPLLCAVGVFLVGIGLFFWRASRSVALTTTSAALAYLLVGVACLFMSGQVRMRAFARLADSSKPLVQAIHTFERDNGRPPADVQELVPPYLSAIPSTGLGAYPKYNYLAGAEALRIYHGNPWVLWVDTPTGPVNWDVFLYYPRRNYPPEAHGGRLKRVGDWAYVHE